MTDDRPWWSGDEGSAVRVLSRSDWHDRFGRAAGPGPGPEWGASDEARFERGFRTLQDHLARGTLRKGVPITLMSAALSADAAAALFSRALVRVADLPPRLVPYGFFRPASSDGDAEFLIGATPELLFDFAGDRSLSTMAVAGTRLSAEGPDSLRDSPKDRDEHRQVVDDLLAQLSVWGSPRAAATEVRTFGALEHLVTEIRLDADRPLDFETVARRLHPTPALGVCPRSPEGTAWLAGLDPHGERGRFGAPFGLRLAGGGGRCAVAIRNLQYRHGRLDVWVGCGVVRQSRYDNERDEVLRKLEAVRALWNV